MTSDLFLVQFFADRPRNEWPLRLGTQTIGRSHHCDIVIIDETISREHARISLEGQLVRVSDLKSRNGTYIDGLAVESDFIAVGSTVRFGRIECVVVNTELLSNLHQDFSTVRQELQKADGNRCSLSVSEQRVLTWLLEGFSEKEVASKLKISRHTVHNHVRMIYRAFKVTSRGELLARFVQK